MTGRKHRKALERWEHDTRLWAHETARDLVMSMVRGQPTPATPYTIGVVLNPGECVWAECPVRFLQERPVGTQAGPDWFPPIRPWLVTSERVVGRLGDDRLYSWRWDRVVGCRVELDPGVETVALDLQHGSRVVWIGPGTAPLAVAAVCRLHGPGALVLHAGLAPLRQAGQRPTAK